MNKKLLFTITFFIFLMQGCGEVSKVTQLEQIVRDGGSKEVEASYFLGLYYEGKIALDGKALRDRRDLDYKKAKEFLEFSALKEYAVAQYALGELYEDLNYIDDENYLGKRCPAINKSGPHNNSYEECMWLPNEQLSAKAKEKAISWYQKSANNGDGNAQFKMAISSDTCVDMIKWLEKASFENEHYLAYFNLGTIYLDLRSGDFYDPQKAMRVFAQIANNLKDPASVEELNLRMQARESYSTAKKRSEGRVAKFHKTTASVYFLQKNKGSCEFIHNI